MVIHLRLTNHPQQGAMIFCGGTIPPERVKAETVSDVVIGTDSEGFRNQYIPSEYPRDYTCVECHNAYLESDAAVEAALRKHSK